MAGGNKKKKKPASNPARAVATTSIQSKSKTDTAADTSKPDGSEIDTPNSVARSEPQSSKIAVNGVIKVVERDLHELSPEELEVQLETSELQQFVEKHAIKVRKDASRSISRFQTDKRLLRSQSDYLSVKDWLPEEVMLQILEYTHADLDHENESLKRSILRSGDDLLARIWNLRLCLIGLDVPAERVREACVWVIQHAPPENVASQPWGLLEAMDWLALESGFTGELADYDFDKRNIGPVDSEINELSSDEGVQADASKSRNSHFKRLSDIKSNGNCDITTTSENETSDISDLDSDAEPEELLQIYLRTKEAIYTTTSGDPEVLAKKGGKNPNGEGKQIGGISRRQRQLEERLRKIESDVLFDKREAEILWATKKIDVTREVAQRRKLQLDDGAHTETKNTESTPDLGKDVLAESEELGKQLLREQDSEDEMLGGMFDALPGVADTMPNGYGATNSETIHIRDFGKVTGMTPKRILEEVCRSRDAHCKVTMRQASPTTYSCRHTVLINWSKQQDLINGSFLPFISIENGRKALRATSQSIATPDITQSESYIATVTLFLLVFGSPKEERAHLRLPPAFRDLWDELANLKRESSDSADRITLKELRTLIEDNIPSEPDVDEEVVFNASSRFRSGHSTPSARPATAQMDIIEESQALKEQWNRTVSSPAYQQMLLARMNLPMYHARSEALEMISKHQITIVVGDTGSGKSTQVPQFILEHELAQGRSCKIYCTEPRRISAISLAHRVSDELGESRRDFGTSRSLVGYAVRLDSKVGASTKLVYATVGIVLRMLESENGLQDITHLCLDEVHERSIDSDFLLIVLRSLLLKRPDLKVILMSATVDAQKFSNYLDGAPIISVPGRTFPVETRFLEDAIELTGHTNEDTGTAHAESDDVDEADRQDGAAKANLMENYSKRTRNTLASYDEYRIDHSLIAKLLEKVAYHQEYQRFSKAILVFLPGIAEIRQLNDILLGHPSFMKGWRVHALHSTFSSDEQQAAFEVPPDGIRKIVLATNIAETGITIPDITCVVDAGKHREMRFDERRQMSRLTQSFIARANAKQRRGRAGRVQEGICFHLFTRHRFENMMVDQQTPEMLRLSLQDLVMRVKICKLGDIEQTLAQALDPPSAKNIRRAMDALIEVDALTSAEQLTPLGHQLAKLPLDAQLGKLILFGATFGCLDFTLTVAAAMGSKSPFLSPMHAKKQADSVRLGFKRGDSDLLTLYNAYSTWRKICTTPGMSEYTFCNKNFLSPQNLANIEDLKAQLLTSLVDAGFVKLETEERAALFKVKPNSRQRHFVVLPSSCSRGDNNDLLASSVAAWAFYPKVVKQEGKGWRNIANNQSLGLHPTSVNKATLSAQVKYLSFYSIMQSASRFTNAQETSPVSDFALVLLAGEAVFHMYAGVIVVDGNRLRFKVRDWKTMIALKTLRAKLKECMARLLKHPGRDLGDRQKKWMALIERLFELRANRSLS